jgi:hypothetical protein
MKLSRRAVAAAVRPPLGAPPTGLQAESWRLLREELAADPAAATEYERWAARRAGALPEFRALVERFVAGDAGIEELRATIDRRTRREWDALGLRGVSGAMFLNQLVRRAPDAGALQHALRAALRRPNDDAGARAQLSALVAALAATGAGAAHGAAQPARAVFLTSVVWHAQDPAAWPGYHPSARQALALEDGLFVPSGDPVADYLAFRAAFLALARAIGAATDELEFLCWWHQRHAPAGEAVSHALDRVPPPEPDATPAAVSVVRAPRRRVTPARAAEYPRELSRERPRGRVRETPPGPAARAGARAGAPTGPAADEGAAPDHTHVQWVLASLGRRLGCRVWVAANDRARAWNGQPLGALSVDRMPPLGLDPASERLVRLIDVVWLRGAHQVVAAFEVERTTSVHAGLLRMADLAALAPNLSFPLYVVVPRARLEKVRRELARPTFQALELHRRCGFFSAEALLDAAPEITRWASGPAVLERLAERVGDAPAGARHEPGA